MKYFIDFEATQFSNRIISVGVIRENGDTFYSLVNPGEGKKITKFITELTGITQEDVDVAPSADEVFSKLYDFCAEIDEAPEFYAYGNADVDFARDTFYKMATTLKAKSMLGYIRTGIIDYAPYAKSHFGLSCMIGLKKIAQYYKGEEIVQDHNSLHDAEMLKYVYEQISEHENEYDAFPEYMSAKAAKEVVKKENKSKQKLQIVDYTVFRMKNGRAVETFNSLADAVQWCLEHGVTGDASKAKPENIAKKIKKAAGNSGRYCKNKWVVSPIYHNPVEEIEEE